MDIKDVALQAKAFGTKLDTFKRQIAPAEFGWYPYGTLDNFYLLSQLLTGRNRHLLELAGDAPIADIGAADGDTAFFVESMGFRAHAVDYPPTNYNGCRGVRLLKERLKSSVTIHEADLDSRFDLPGEQYGLAFFLGILYHLKNPYNALESLARCARHAVLSTRVARYNLAPRASGQDGVNRSRVDLDSVPVAYLVAPHETNNDPTNFWIFSDAGLKRLLDRTGWDVLDFTTFGNNEASDPATSAGDQRAFCLIRSRHFPA